MKKTFQKLIVASVLVNQGILFAQPTLTATGSNPVVGDVFSTNGSAYFAAGSAGASQTWNFSTATNTGTSVSTCVTVASTSYAASFPAANTAFSNGGSNYTFQKTSTSSMQNYGNVTSGGTVTMAYSNPEDLLHYPFNFNNTYTDPWAVTFVNATYTYYRVGTTVVTADGWGTLISPTGTYTNVMRVHFVQNYTDSTTIAGSPFVITYSNDEYLWYKDGIHSALAFTFDAVANGSPYQGSGYYSGTAAVSDLNNFNSTFNLFPNPVSDNLTLNFSLSGNNNLELIIMNAIGEIIITQHSIESNIGENNMNIDVSSMPEGIYFARLIKETGISETKKFVITKK